MTELLVRMKFMWAVSLDFGRIPSMFLNAFQEKKDQQAKDREDRIKEQEILNIDGPRHQETKLLKEKLKAKDLAIFEVFILNT